MSGLVKAKKYDWKDSNMAQFGSDTDRQVKKESAECEPAWQGAGQDVGVQIWRIVNFQVTDWPKEDYGKFFSGDSYIILNTYHPEPESEELAWDVHFWIGAHSTQDEYGTVAYKTVELDTFLNDAAIQHREVQGHESPLFLSYFVSLTIMKGGAESGFRHVVPEEYKPRLFHINGKRKNVKVDEVPLCKKNISSDDVFIIDSGSKLVQWNGANSAPMERHRAAEYLQQLESEQKASSEVFDECDCPLDSAIFDALANEAEDEDGDDGDYSEDKKLFKLSDESGHMEVALVKEGDVNPGDFDSNDVFILDTGCACFVWLGEGSSITEKRNAMSYAHEHLKKTTHPFAPVTIIKEGCKNAAFASAIAA